MDSNNFVKQTGSAFFWRAAQLFGTKGIYTLRTLLLSYILLPQDFGLFAVTVISIELLITITDFGFIPALVHHSNPENVHYNSIWSLSISRGLIISSFVFLFAPLIAEMFAQPEAAPFIRIASFKPLLENSASIKIAELTRQLKFRQLSYLKLSDALVSLIISVVFAPIIGVWGLLIGILAGTFTYSVLSYILAPYKPKFSINYSAIKPIIKFSQWMYLSVLISVAGSLTIQLIITRDLGLTELGLYFLAVHLAFFPSEIIKEVFGSVMFPVFVQIRHNKEKLTAAYKSFFYIIVILIVPVCILMIYIAPYLVEFILSAKWKGTTQLIQIFAAVNLIGLLGESSVPLLNATGRTKNIFILDLVQTVLLLLLCITFIKNWGINGAAASWIPAIFISQILSLYYLSKILINPFKGMTPSLITIFVSSIIGSIIGYYITTSYSGIVGLFSGVTVSGLILITAMFLTDYYFNLGIRKNLYLAFPKIHNYNKV